MRRQEWGAANAPCAQTNRGKCAANLGEADGVGVWEGVEDLLVVEVVLDVESVPHDEVEDEQRQAHLQGRGIMAFFSGQRFKGDANRGGHQERDVGLREDASLSPMEWEDDGESLLTTWWGARRVLGGLTALFSAVLGGILVLSAGIISSAAVRKVYVPVAQHGNLPMILHTSGCDFLLAPVPPRGSFQTFPCSRNAGQQQGHETAIASESASAKCVRMALRQGRFLARGKNRGSCSAAETPGPGTALYP